MSVSSYKQMRAGQEAGLSPSQAFGTLGCSCVLECGRFMCVNRDRRHHVHFDEKPCPRHGRNNGGEE